VNRRNQGFILLSLILFVILFLSYADMGFWSTSFPFSQRNFFNVSWKEVVLRGTFLMFLGRKLYYNEFTHFHFSEKLIISLHFHGCRILVWYFFLLPVILNMPLYSLLPFIVSDEISDVILIFFLSEVYPYSLPLSFKVFFAFGF